MNFSGVDRSTLLGRALRWPLKLLPRGLEVPIVQGPLRGWRWIVGAGTHGCWLGSYEAAKARLFARHIQRGNVVYDVGANVGFYTLLSASCVGADGKVVAFEPLPRNQLYLRRHVALNNASNVQIIDAAVCDRSGEARFDDSRDPSMGELAPTGGITVKTVSLDELIDQGAIPLPDLIKIDVEGAEDAVLRGAADLLKRHKPRIFLATHGTRAHQSCCAHLTQAGYDLYAVGGGNVAEQDEIYAVKRSGPGLAISVR